MSKWSTIENIVIYAVILGITIAGLVLDRSWVGLWSLVLLIAVNRR